MTLGKRSGVIASKEQKVIGDKVPSAAVDEDVIGSDGGAAMKKYGQHVGGAAHEGDVLSIFLHRCS